MTELRASTNIRWTGLSQIGRIGLQFVGLLVLPRFLSAADYGVVAMAMVATNLATLLLDMGSSAALIQRKELSDDVTTAVFWFNTVLGVLLGGILLAFAPLIARMMHTPGTLRILLVLAPTFPLAGVSATHQALMERTSRFRALAFIELSSAVLGVTVAIALAVSGVGYLSLAAQSLIAALASCVLMWCISTWRPRAFWNRKALSEIWRFSSRLTGFQLIHYCTRNADAFVIGRFLGAGDVGCYAMASKLMLLPYQLIVPMTNRAMFPLMAKQQDSVDNLSTTFLKTVSVTAFIGAPLIAIMWALKRSLVLALLGTRWSAVADVLTWLAPAGFMHLLASTAMVVFMSTGRTDLLMRIGLVHAVMAVSSYVIGVRWGITGVAACYLLATAVYSAYCFSVTLTLMRRRPRDLASSIGTPVLLAGAAGLLVFLGEYVLTSLAVDPWRRVAMLLPVCMSAYLVGLYVFARTELKMLSSAVCEAAGCRAFGVPDVARASKCAIEESRS